MANKERMLEIFQLFQSRSQADGARRLLTLIKRLSAPFASMKKQPWGRLAVTFSTLTALLSGPKPGEHARTAELTLQSPTTGLAAGSAEWTRCTLPSRKCRIYTLEPRLLKIVFAMTARVFLSWNSFDCHWLLSIFKWLWQIVVILNINKSPLQLDDKLSVFLFFFFQCLMIDYLSICSYFCQKRLSKGN